MILLFNYGHCCKTVELGRSSLSLKRGSCASAVTGGHVRCFLLTGL